jgi:hypothetical protein
VSQCRHKCILSILSQTYELYTVKECSLAVNSRHVRPPAQLFSSEQLSNACPARMRTVHRCPLLGTPSPAHWRACRNAIYFSNRSAAAANLCRFDEALADAKAVLRLKPGWVKGHARAAAAYMGLQLYSEAKEVNRALSVCFRLCILMVWQAAGCVPRRQHAARFCALVSVQCENTWLCVTGRQRFCPPACLTGVCCVLCLRRCHCCCYCTAGV